MSNYQFIASLVSSLAWPLAMVLCAFMFRRKLIELMPKLRMKYGDIDVSFRLERAEQDAKALPPIKKDLPAIDTPTAEERRRFEWLAESSPRAAMLETRSEFEEAVEKLGTAAGLDGKAFTVIQINRYLREHGLITSAVSALIEHLRSIGNVAIHSPGEAPSKGDVLRYRRLVELLISKLPNHAHQVELSLSRQAA